MDRLPVEVALPFNKAFVRILLDGRGDIRYWGGVAAGPFVTAAGREVDLIISSLLPWFGKSNV